MANADLYIKPALPEKIFPWQTYNPQTREEIDAFFNSPDSRVVTARMVDMVRRLWNR